MTMAQKRSINKKLRTDRVISVRKEIKERKEKKQ